MFDLLQVFPAHEVSPLEHDSPHHGSAAAADPWLAQVLDQIDHGLLTVDEDGQVLHANRVAVAELADPEHALQLLGSELRARYTLDLAKLQSALADARAKGLRRLLALGGAHAPVSVAVVPLPVPSDAARAWRGSRHATLLVEHDMDAVFRIADWITVMVNGAVIASAAPDDIRTDPAVQSAYLGGHA